MNTSMSGRVIKLDGDNIDTDVIAPAEWWTKGRGQRQLETLRPHAFEAIRPGLDQIVQPGDIFVVGKNFGCGSHREPAVFIFKVWGVQAVVAESAGRIWFRNAIGAGLPAFQLPGVTKMFEEGDHIEIDLAKWKISNLSKGDAKELQPFPPTVMRILEADGILALAKARIDRQMAVKAGLPE